MTAVSKMWGVARSKVPNFQGFYVRLEACNVWKGALLDRVRQSIVGYMRRYYQPIIYIASINA